MTLAQTTPAPPLERLRGIRDHLAMDSTFLDLAIVLLVVATIVVVVFGSLALIHRRRTRRIRNPGRLFRELLRRLPLDGPQRDLLRRIARDLRLDQPAVLVLSPQVFRSHANRWMSLARRANRETERRVTRFAETLFPPPGLSPETSVDVAEDRVSHAPAS